MRVSESKESQFETDHCGPYSETNPLQERDKRKQATLTSATQPRLIGLKKSIYFNRPSSLSHGHRFSACPPTSSAGSSERAAFSARFWRRALLFSSLSKEAEEVQGGLPEGGLLTGADHCHEAEGLGCRSNPRV